MAVLSVTQVQNVDAAGTLQDMYEITFTVDDRPGSFTVDVPKQANALDLAAAAVGATRDQVLGIYGLPS